MNISDLLDLMAKTWMENGSDSETFELYWTRIHDRIADAEAEEEVWNEVEDSQNDKLLGC